MIEYWKAGVELGENEQYHEAIRKFLDMPEPGARIYFNVANMYLRLGKLIEAEEVISTTVIHDNSLYPLFVVFFLDALYLYAIVCFVFLLPEPSYLCQEGSTFSYWIFSTRLSKSSQQEVSLAYECITSYLS